MLEHSIVERSQHGAGWQKAIVLLTGTVMAFGVILGLYWGRPLLVPIALAALLTVLLNPVVGVLQRWRLGRVPAVLVGVVLGGILFGMLGWAVMRQVSGVVSELPQYTSKITKKVRSLKQLGSGETAKKLGAMVDQVSREVDDVLKSARKTAPQPSHDETEQIPEASPEGVVVRTVPSFWDGVPEYLGSALEVAATLLFALVLLIFFLLGENDIRDRLVLLAGRAHLTITSKALQDISDRITKYITMISLVNGSFGILLAMGLYFMGMPYAFLWGIQAAFLRFFPYIGPWIGAFFPIMISLAVSDGWVHPAMVISFVVILDATFNNFVDPLVIGKSMGVSPTAMLISAAFWLYLWGPMGLLFSPPIAVCLVVIGKNVPQLRFLNILIGDQPALSAPVSFYQRLILKNHIEAEVVVSSRLKEIPKEEIYDDLLIPALSYARRDEQKNHLSDEDYLAVTESLREQVVRLHEKPEAVENNVDAGEPLARRKLVCCPATDQSDVVALEMLAQLLDQRRWEIELISHEMLASELVTRLKREPPQAICIATVAPGGVAHAGYLCKRLHHAAGEIPLVVGRWGEKHVNKVDKERLQQAGATAVTTSLLETRQILNSYLTVSPRKVLDAEGLEGTSPVVTSNGAKARGAAKVSRRAR